MFLRCKAQYLNECQKCSAPHSLLARGKVDPLHPDLAVDPFGILRLTNKLSHQLPLVIYILCLQSLRTKSFLLLTSMHILQVSAYSSFARMGGVAPGVEQQRRRMDPATNEPLFTNCTRDFVGTVDYIFYTGMTFSVLFIFLGKFFVSSKKKRRRETLITAYLLVFKNVLFSYMILGAYSGLFDGGVSVGALG